MLRPRGALPTARRTGAAPPSGGPPVDASSSGRDVLKVALGRSAAALGQASAVRGGVACERAVTPARSPAASTLRPAGKGVVREVGVHERAGGPEVCGVAAGGVEVPVEVDLVPAPGARPCEAVACARAVTPAKSPTAAAAARRRARM